MMHYGVEALARQRHQSLLVEAELRRRAGRSRRQAEVRFRAGRSVSSLVLRLTDLRARRAAGAAGGVGPGAA
jgi:hypothetical protein